MSSDTRMEVITISSDEVRKTSEKLGIEPKYIGEAVERQRADERYRETKSHSNSKNKSNKLDTGFRFLQNIIYSTSRIPNFATVTKIESPKNYNIIKIHTESDYPNLPTDSSKEFTKTFKYNLPSDSDKLQSLLDFVGVSSPSKLKDKSIPIKPNTRTKGRSKLHKVYYNIHQPKDTVWSKCKYYTYRAGMKLRLFERVSKCGNYHKYGDYTVNKNICLLLFIVTSPILFTNSLLFFISLIFLFIYSLFLGHNLLYGIYSFITEEEGNRLYIRQKIEK